MTARQDTNDFWFRVATACVSIVIGSLLAIWPAHAQVINFETNPLGFIPIDDELLLPSNPYTFGPLQISFGFDANSDGIVDLINGEGQFEEVGLQTPSDPSGEAGFSGSGGTDTADACCGGLLGSYFLRSPVGGSDFGQLIITYIGGTVTAASGEIWDIDGIPPQPPVSPGFTEEYTVRAYDTANNLLATQVSPLGTLDSSVAPLDGKPWVFAFSGITAGIAKIEIDFTGTKVMGIGLAFNNFYPTSVVPEPASWLLVASAGCWLALRRRSRTPRPTVELARIPTPRKSCEFSYRSDDSQSPTS